MVELVIFIVLILSVNVRGSAELTPFDADHNVNWGSKVPNGNAEPIAGGSGESVSWASSGDSKKQENRDICVQIYKEYKIGRVKSGTCQKDCTITLDDIFSLGFICMLNEKSTIKWKDSYNFGPPEKCDKSLELDIKPYQEDHNKTFTCTASSESGNRSITVTLKTTTKETIPEDEKKLKIADEWPEDCYGLAYDLSKTESSGRVEGFNSSGYHSVIKRFGDSLNGTKFDCIRYKCDDKKKFRSGSVLNTKVSKCERTETRYVFNLDREAIYMPGKGWIERNSHAEKGQEILRQGPAANAREEKSDSSSTTTAILGGVLGSIVLLLLSLILGISYKALRRQTPDDEATQVIYTEIEERPVAPPRNQTPYSKIIDSLVPSDQASPNAYAVIDYKTKANPYATICETNENPYAIPDCQTKEKPYASVKRETKVDPYATVFCETKEDPYATVFCETKENPYAVVRC